MAHHPRLRPLLLAIVAVFALSAEASAQGKGSDKGNGGQSESGSSSDSGNQGNGNGSGNTGKGGGPPATVPGQGNANGRQQAPGQDEDLALEAVRSRRALPLQDILATARPSIEGKIIDARLVTLRGLLVYEVKSLAQDGRVSRTYYYARSGRQVGSD